MNKTDALRKKITQSLTMRPTLKGFVPTPCYLHEGLSADTGLNLYIKREDRIDDLGCGNKYRRLSHVIPFAKENGADTLITVGSLPSNQCKAVEFFGHQYGMRTHIIFGGDTHTRPESAQGNYLLTSLINSPVSWFDYTPWVKMHEKIEQVMQDEMAKGYKPYVIISGAPEWPGILGSIELGFEIFEQLGAEAHKPLGIVVPAGSGGTCLGIAIAAEIMGLPWTIYGVLIGETIQRIMDRVNAIRKVFSEKTGIALIEGSPNLKLWDKALGGGYDNTQDYEIEEMLHNLKNHGLFFDLNYMVKAYIGLKQLKDASILSHNENILLIHTGGQYGLFDDNPVLQKWLQNNRSEWLGKLDGHSV